MAQFADVRRIGQVDVVALEAKAAVDLVVAAVDARRAGIFAFCNAHTVNLARHDRDFEDALRRATVFNDGVGVDIASRLLHGSAFPANLNGTDLTPMILSALAARPQSTVFLVGSKAGVAVEAARAIEAQYPDLRVVGAHHGYFDDAEGAQLVAKIREAAPSLVLLGMGQPRQEIWAAATVERLETAILCVGAFLDFVSGTIPRAPIAIRKARLEWAFRLALEPRRLARRYLIGNLAFLLSVAKAMVAR